MKDAYIPPIHFILIGSRAQESGPFKPEPVKLQNLIQWNDPVNFLNYIIKWKTHLLRAPSKH